MTDDDRIKLEASWKSRIGDYLQRPEMRALSDFLRAEKHAGKVIYPPGPEIFNAFTHTPFDSVRVVILGQDPYHGPGAGAWFVLLGAPWRAFAAVAGEYL